MFKEILDSKISLPKKQYYIGYLVNKGCLIPKKIILGILDKYPNFFFKPYKSQESSSIFKVRNTNILLELIYSNPKHKTNINKILKILFEQNATPDFSKKRWENFIYESNYKLNDANFIKLYDSLNINTKYYSSSYKSNFLEMRNSLRILKYCKKRGLNINQKESFTFDSLHYIYDYLKSGLDLPHNILVSTLYKMNYVYEKKKIKEYSDIFNLIIKKLRKNKDYNRILSSINISIIDTMIDDYPKKSELHTLRKEFINLESTPIAIKLNPTILFKETNSDLATSILKNNLKLNKNFSSKEVCIWGESKLIQKDNNKKVFRIPIELYYLETLKELLPKISEERIFNTIKGHILTDFNQIFKDSPNSYSDEIKLSLLKSSYEQNRLLSDLLAKRDKSFYGFNYFLPENPTSIQSIIESLKIQFDPLPYCSLSIPKESYNKSIDGYTISFAHEIGYLKKILMNLNFTFLQVYQLIENIRTFGGYVLLVNKNNRYIDCLHISNREISYQFKDTDLTYKEIFEVEND
jgi:hypothetical protein